jgi:HEAT repeats
MRKHCNILWTMTVLVLAITATWWVNTKRVPQREGCFRGQTTSQWEWTLRRWAIGTGGKHNGWRSTSWVYQPSFVERHLEKLGFQPEAPCSLPLLEGDPEAVPVLVELLKSPDPKVRQIAVQGLEKIGEQARAGTSGLVEALDDPEEEVRRDAAQALFTVDRAAAESAGLQAGLWWSVRDLEPGLPKSP